MQSQLAAIGIKVTITVNQNWAIPFFAKELTFSLYGTTGRDSQTADAQGPFRPERAAEPQLALRGLRLRGGSRQGRGQTPIGSADYAANLQAATLAGEQSEALIFVYSAPNLFAKSKSISALPGDPGHVDFTGVTISGQ